MVPKNFELSGGAGKLEVENDTRNDKKNLALKSRYSGLCFMLMITCHLWPSIYYSRTIQAAYTGCTGS